MVKKKKKPGDKPPDNLGTESVNVNENENENETETENENENLYQDKSYQTGLNQDRKTESFFEATRESDTDRSDDSEMTEIEPETEPDYGKNALIELVKEAEEEEEEEEEDEDEDGEEDDNDNDDDDVDNDDNENDNKKEEEEE